MKHKQATEFLNNIKNQHKIESTMAKQVQKRLAEANVTQDALLKLLQITVFIVQEIWVHTKNVDDFVRFVGMDLEEEVLKGYLKICHNRKNATHISSTAVTDFIKVINDYVKDKSLTELRNATDFMLMLDQAMDNGNRSELSLIARLVDGTTVKNVFLDFLCLSPGDANSIFSVIHRYFVKENIDISKTRFTAMDRCSTMSGSQGGVKVYFEVVSGHCVYVHC